MECFPANPNVVYAGHTFVAHLDELGRTTTCVPVVYNGESDCGVGIYYTGNNGDVKLSVWGMVFPRNLIAAWRACQILRHVERIGHGTLATCYYAGVRDPHPSNERYRDELVAMIGSVKYRRIMALPVPTDIVQFIVDHQHGEMYDPDVWPISDEIRYGTIPWRETFAYIGVKPHQSVPAVIGLKRQTLIPFESLLADVSHYLDYPRHCPGMDSIEDAVFEMVDQGIEQPDKVIVAVAMLENEFRWHHEAAERAAKWLNKAENSPRHWFRRSQSRTDLLLALREHYFPNTKKVEECA